MNGKLVRRSAEVVDVAGEIDLTSDILRLWLRLLAWRQTEIARQLEECGACESINALWGHSNRLISDMAAELQQRTGRVQDRDAMDVEQPAPVAMGFRPDDGAFGGKFSF